MSLTGWTLVLAATGTAGFFVRKKWIKRRHLAKLDELKRKRRADEAELDRIACEDLGQSLISSSPGSNPRDAAGKAGAGGSRSSG